MELFKLVEKLREGIQVFKGQKEGYLVSSRFRVFFAVRDYVFNHLDGFVFEIIEMLFHA